MKKQNWEILSLTRFLLALVVMIGHLQGFIHMDFIVYYAYLGSFEAILGFLLISGFSIGKSIARSPHHYVERRIKRIYPVYLASIAFQIFVSGINSLTLPYLLFNLLFLNQIITASSFVGPSWTLQTEVMLYTLAPLFLQLSRKILVSFIFISFAAYILYTCGRTLYHWDYYAGTIYGINLVLLAFIWIAGFVLAVFPSYKKENSFIIALLFGGHILLTIAIQVGFRIKHHKTDDIINIDLPLFIGSTLCLCFVYYVVVLNKRIKAFSKRVSQVFDWLGNISYPLYLTHYTTFSLLKNFGVMNEWLMIAASLFVAIFIYYVFDFYTKKRVSK